MKNGQKLDTVQVRGKAAMRTDGLQKSREAEMNGKLGTIDIQKMLIDLSGHLQLSKQEEGDMVNEKQGKWGNADVI